MFKKVTTTINKGLAVIFLSIFTSPSFAAWSDLNMTQGVTAISKEVFGLHMLIFWICVELA